MQGAKCAISKLMYGLSVCTDYNQSLKLVAYRLVHTDEPYINLHLSFTNVPIKFEYQDIFFLFCFSFFFNLAFTFFQVTILKNRVWYIARSQISSKFSMSEINITFQPKKIFPDL